MKSKSRRIQITVTVLFLTALQASALNFSIATSFDRTFSDKWTHAPAGIPPKLSANDTTYSGLSPSLYLFISDYSRNAFGIADVAFSCQLLAPDGKMVRDSTGITAFIGIVDPDAGTLLSGSVPRIVFSRKDTPGAYTLRVTAEDRIAGAKIAHDKKIILSGYPFFNPVRFDVISFNVWVHNYCIAPDPARAVSAFSWFVNSESSNDERIFWPVFYFFQSLFYDNPALVGELAGAFRNGTPRFREYAVFLLRVIGTQRSDGRFIPDSLWKKFDEAAGEGYLDPIALAVKSKTVQFVETGFYYFGRYELIRFLIDCLGLGTPAADNEFVKKNRGGTGAGTAHPDRETLLQFRSDAHLVLSKAYPKHPLVRTFCDFALANERLNSDAKKTLSEIIDVTHK